MAEGECDCALYCPQWKFASLDTEQDEDNVENMWTEGFPILLVKNII